MGGRDEMQTEAASLRGEAEQDLHRIGVGLGENAKLVDRDDETRRGSGHAERIGLVSALPRGEVREAERPECLLAPLEYRRNPVQCPGRGTGVKVGEERLGVWERLEPGEGRPALVVDEDEADLFGAVAVRDSGKPPEECLGLTRSGTPGDEGVRPVGDQVQVDGPLLSDTDPHAEPAAASPRRGRVPVEPRRQAALRVCPRDGPPPVRAHGLVIGDAHLRAPGRKERQRGGVSDVERRAGGAARAVRAGIAVADVDIHTRVPNQHGSGAVPPHARPAKLSGDLAGAPQRALRRVGTDDADRLALARLSTVSGRRQPHASPQARGPTRPHGRPHGARGSRRGRKPRKDEGERPAVPAPATPACPPRQGNRGGDRGQHNSRAGRCEHGGQ